MTWAKLDDQFHAHRKAKRAWKEHPRALGLHMLAYSYCAGQLTNGLVDDEFVEEKLPIAKERDAVTSALVDAGLWTREDDGWRIHDWLDYNPSRDEILERRQRDAERKAKGRRTQSAKSPDGVRADSEGTQTGVEAESDGPDPTRPDPTPHIGSPRVSNAGVGTDADGNGTTSISKDEVELAHRIHGILLRGLDGLTTTEKVRAPTREAVVAVLGRHRPDPDVATAAAIDAREITQVQDRAPNVVGLFEKQLLKAMGIAA